MTSDQDVVHGPPCMNGVTESGVHNGGALLGCFARSRGLGNWILGEDRSGPPYCSFSFRLELRAKKFCISFPFSNRAKISDPFWDAGSFLFIMLMPFEPGTMPPTRLQHIRSVETFIIFASRFPPCKLNPHAVINLLQHRFCLDLISPRGVNHIPAWAAVPRTDLLGGVNHVPGPAAPSAD